MGFWGLGRRFSVIGAATAGLTGAATGASAPYGASRDGVFAWDYPPLFLPCRIFSRRAAARLRPLARPVLILTLQCSRSTSSDMSSLSLAISSDIPSFRSWVAEPRRSACGECDGHFGVFCIVDYLKP